MSDGSATTIRPHGATRDVLVLSGRRLLAEAVATLLNREGEGWRAVVEPAVRVREPTAPFPSVIIVDLDDPDLVVDELAAYLEGSTSIRRIGVFDTFSAAKAQAAFELGVTTLLPLSAPLEKVVAVVAGDVSSTATAAEGPTPAELRRLASLTKREMDVLQLLAQGLPVKAIAQLLGISAHTIDTHKRRCYAKLGVQQRSQAIALVVRAGAIAGGVT